ncbi:MAG: hypothetical protein HYX89_05170, partial [Chloroflexi bacterium]|nr:hypothetical protein [Chloroflexota bacterium]
ALADAILYLYEHPELRREMGERGREHVVTHYARSKLLPQLEEVLVRAVDGDASTQTAAGT